MGLKFSRKKNKNYYNDSNKIKKTKKQKIVIKEYPFRPDLVKITKLDGSPLEKMPKYSYVYKGVPGGWYFD